GRGAHEPTLGAIEVLDQRWRCEVNPAVLGEEQSWESRRERAEVDSVRMPLQLPDREAMRGPPAVRTGAKSQVHAVARRKYAWAECGQGPAEPSSPQPRGELGEDLPVVPGIGCRGEERRGPLGGVADGEEVEDDVVVLAFQRGGGREQHVGVAG